MKDNPSDGSLSRADSNDVTGKLRKIKSPTSEQDKKSVFPKQAEPKVEKTKVEENKEIENDDKQMLVSSVK